MLISWKVVLCWGHQKSRFPGSSCWIPLSTSSWKTTCHKAFIQLRFFKWNFNFQERPRHFFWPAKPRPLETIGEPKTCGSMFHHKHWRINFHPHFNGVDSSDPSNYIISPRFGVKIKKNIFEKTTTLNMVYWNKRLTHPLLEQLKKLFRLHPRRLT